MTVLEKRRPITNGVYLGAVFVFIDLVLFTIFWTTARGPIPLDIDAWLVLAQIWNIVHAPTNEIFGPYVFPYFKDHAGDWATLLGMMPYFILCFLQVFIAGILIGYLLSYAIRFLATKYSSRVR